MMHTMFLSLSLPLERHKQTVSVHIIIQTLSSSMSPPCSVLYTKALSQKVKNTLKNRPHASPDCVTPETSLPFTFTIPESPGRTRSLLRKVFTSEYNLTQSRAGFCPLTCCSSLCLFVCGCVFALLHRGFGACFGVICVHFTHSNDSCLLVMDADHLVFKH